MATKVKKTSVKDTGDEAVNKTIDAILAVADHIDAKGDELSSCNFVGHLSSVAVRVLDEFAKTGSSNIKDLAQFKIGKK